jgi:hypothetical protein
MVQRSGGTAKVNLAPLLTREGQSTCARISQIWTPGRQHRPKQALEIMVPSRRVSGNSSGCRASLERTTKETFAIAGASGGKGDVFVSVRPEPATLG